ncbi:hypothetical protein [Mesorhizobium sp. A623]
MHNEREIDALLSQDDAGSIFDKLMALPRPAEQTQTGNEWDRAVASRFQTHLVKQMRMAIDGGEIHRSAA